ncbi:30S ribosomal protein S9 [Candidatus Uhrbacteria bacterium]|nr:30S ribosomal protein S9 [Candidatus Uhrbacteria bacterium]
MTTKETQSEQEQPKRHKAKGDGKALVFRAVGRRKEAIARVLIAEGIGKITVNGKDYTQYFPTFELQKNVQAPLELTNTAAGLDVSVKVIGGGVRGQADAVRHGISRALLALNQDLRKTLRAEGFLTRDPRVKERKKPGLKRARRAPQFSKR